MKKLAIVLIGISFLSILNPLQAECRSDRIKGFQKAWIDPDCDFNKYKAIYIYDVDTSDVELEEKEIRNLGFEMKKRFSKILSAVMPVKTDINSVSERRTLAVHLKLKEIAGMECDMKDFRTGKKLVSVEDRHEASGWEPNASWLGSEDLDKWAHAYNTMDLWADRLAKFLAKKRGQRYKTQIKFKLF